MLKPNSKRQASVGEEGLSVPDHHTADSFRASRSSGNNNSYQFSSVAGTPLTNLPNGRSSFLDTSTNVPIPTMSPIVTSNKGLGEAGTFRSAAMARLCVNSSRRNLLRENRLASFKGTGGSGGTGGGESISLLYNNTNSERIPEHQELEAAPNDSAPHPEYQTFQALKSIIAGKPVSIFLLLMPLAVWSHYGKWGAEYVFWLNFCVMIPLASILGDFTEEAALHTNESIGGLLNATFGNAVEVVVAIQALLANEIRVVQASMIGSIFSNLLLVLGCCFFFGGLYYKEQTFNATAASANMGLLALSSIALVLPTPFAEYYNVQDEHVLIISRFAALFLLFMYVQLLVFQLHTHKHIFDEPVSENANVNNNNAADGEEGEEDEEPTISMPVALFGLLVTTLTVTVFSDYLVGSIDAFCETSGISRTFVGLIILPIVGNAVEHITAVTVAMKDKMDLSMGGMVYLYEPCIMSDN